MESERMDERQACWEDVLRVIENAIDDVGPETPDAMPLLALYEAIWSQGWEEMGTGDGKPLHKKSDSKVNQWLKERGRKPLASAV